MSKAQIQATRKVDKSGHPWKTRHVPEITSNRGDGEYDHRDTPLRFAVIGVRDKEVSSDDQHWAESLIEGE